MIKEYQVIGMTRNGKTPNFNQHSGFLIDIPDEVNEMYFFLLFLTDDVLADIVLQTNKYADLFLQKEGENLPPKSRFRQWPEGGITVTDLKTFIALTFYFGVVKKENVKSYWSTDSVYSTPYPAKVMSRDKFLNIFSLFHLCDNDTYIANGQPGYDPRKKKS